MGIDRLRRISYEIETAFATENGAHTWRDIRAVDPRLDRQQSLHEISEVQQRITQYAGQVLGRKSASKLSFTLPLRGDGVSLATGATAADDYLQDLLQLAMGGGDSDAGSTSAAGSTTTVINVQAGHGSRFHVGGAILVENGGGSGIYEMSIIESIAVDALTLKHALTAAPAADDDIINSYTAFVDPSATSTAQFRCLSDDTAENWLCLGCIGGITLSNLLQLDGTLPMVGFDWAVTEWETESDTLAVATYDGGDHLGTANEMEIIYEDHGTTTRTTISASSLEVNPGIVWSQLLARGNADKEHVDRYRMTACRPTATLTVDPSADYDTELAGATAKALVVTFGRTPGQCWAIELPRCYVQTVPQRAAHAEQVAQTITLIAGEDDAAATAIGRSPIRIHRF